MKSTIGFISPALKMSIIFFLTALALQFTHDLINNNWNFTTLEIKEFTLMVPILIFAWQTITSASSAEIREIVSGLPDAVRDGTHEEINTLKEDNEKFRRQLAKGVVEHDKHSYRTLTYKKDEGSLFNGFGDAKDSSRNVLFSNKTINLILREIRDTDPGNQDLLHNIGRSASERFASEMVRDIQKQYGSDNVDLTDWLIKWIEFDSDAGFGKFDLEGDINNWKENQVILLKYSFLTQECMDDRKRNSGLCRFMTGYLEGIINSFPPNILEPYELEPGRISILHDSNSPKECICARRPEHEGCRYHLSSKG